jgi:cytochrome c-type biogenesis protein CcmF
VAYVAAQSNSQLPFMYRIAGVWGGHEGSMLLWGLMLASWGALLGVYTKRIPLQTAAKVLGVMGVVSVGFLWFMLATSNPFDRLIPAPLDGRDLNPCCRTRAWSSTRRCSTWAMSVSRWRSRSPSRP